jgi:hypothetical protein
MGLTFLSEEQRNPTNYTPDNGLPTIDHCAEIKAERDLMNQFLEELGHAITYDLWKDAKAEVERIQKIQNENNGFEPVE